MAVFMSFVELIDHNNLSIKRFNNMASVSDPRYNFFFKDINHVNPSYNMACSDKIIACSFMRHDLI